MSTYPNNNKVMVELDPENDSIETASGEKLYIDTSYEPEKHVVRVGTVKALPKHLYFKRGDIHSMPWRTDVELKVGDRVVMYYLAVMNCFNPEYRRYIKEDGKTTVFIGYENVYAAIRNDEIVPINGYVLVEPMEDPNWEDVQEKTSKAGIHLPDMRELSKTNVTYGKVAYLASPIKEYSYDHQSDEHIDLKVGDEVILKKVRDIPIEYEYHTKVGNKRKLYRMHRFDIVAKL